MSSEAVIKSALRFGLVAALLPVLLAGGDWAGPMPSAEALRTYDRVCNTYDNRARFLPREGPLDFVTVMADGCASARASLERGGVRERAAAVRFLERLTRFRATIFAINKERMFGKDAGPLARPQRAASHFGTFDAVSAAGEVLIAHRMGLFAAYDDWRAERRVVALARPD